jgi:hypothetical protein
VKRTPLRARSAKQARIDRLRKKIREELFAEDPMCRRCRVRPGQILHEVLRRGQGGSPVDRSIITLICQTPCHDWIHANPEQARQDGWLTFRKDVA